MNTIAAIIAAQQNDMWRERFNSHVIKQWAAGNNYRVQYVIAEFGFPMPREKFFMNANDLAAWYEEQRAQSIKTDQTFHIERMWVWLDGGQREVDDFTPFIKKIH